MNDVAPSVFAPQYPARFSIEEFMRLVGTGAFSGMGRVELVEGVIVRMSPAQPPHMHYKRLTFVALLDAYREARDWAVHSELTLKLGSATLRESDVGVIRPFGPDRDYPDPATVLLLVEVADSSLIEDMGTKLRDYARANIPHYWVVDVNNRHIHMMTTPLDGDYAERRLAAFGDPLAVPGTDRTIVIG